MQGGHREEVPGEEVPGGEVPGRSEEVPGALLQRKNDSATALAGPTVVNSTPPG